MPLIRKEIVYFLIYKCGKIIRNLGVDLPHLSILVLHDCHVLDTRMSQQMMLAGFKNLVKPQQQTKSCNRFYSSHRPTDLRQVFKKC